MIAVNTGLNNGQAYLSDLLDVCSNISKTNPNALDCMESTVFVGTCRMLIHYLLSHSNSDPLLVGVIQADEQYKRSRKICKEN